MTNLIFSTVLMLCYGTNFLIHGKPQGASGPQVAMDSYAIIPSKQQSQGSFPPNSELNLDMVPPSVLQSSSPYIYYMTSDGIAQPAESQEIQQKRRRRRDVEASINNQNHVAPSSSFSSETMNTDDETIIIGPPSGRQFSSAGIQLGYRPAHTSYARRYHKYPWNYH